MSQLLCLNIGNTHIQCGLYTDEVISEQHTFSAHSSELNEYLKQCQSKELDIQAIITGSVNPEASEAIKPALLALDADVIEVEIDFPVPVGRKLDPQATIGADRLLNAAAAYDQFKQSCIVVDIGTAITVDFVDGEGTFHGGAISPGIQLMLDSLSAGTKQLPTIDFNVPELTFGDNTESAMCLGVWAAARGQVQFLAERYSEAIGHYPKIIATGGLSQSVFSDDQLIERIIPSLTLDGLRLSYKTLLKQAEESE